MIIEEYRLTEEMVATLMEAHGLDAEDEKVLNDFANQMAAHLDNFFLEALNKASEETLKDFK